MKLHRRLSAFVAGTLLCLATLAHAQSEPPDALVKRVSADVLDAVKADPKLRTGQVDPVIALVDAKLLPFLDLERMTASAVGPGWNQATPEQKQALQTEFKTLLIRVYSGAIAQAADKTIVVRPSRGGDDAKDVVVRTQIQGPGEPVPLDFRLERADGGWKVFDVNVSGVWLVENYRGSFAQQVNAGGIDGLIKTLRDKNQSNARR